MNPSDNVFSLFRSRFPADETRPLFLLPDGREISYGAVEQATRRYAAALRAAGLVPGDRVAVQVEKSPENVILYLAVLRAGGVYLPLNTAYTPAEMGYFLGDAEPRIVVVTPAAEAVTRPLLPADAVLFTLGEAGDGTLPAATATADEEDHVEPRAADDLAGICYTSGTTGRSKGAMLTHGNLAANALTLHRLWGFRPDDVLLHALPIFHIHGLFIALHTTLLNGTPMHFLPRFDAEQVLRLLPRSTVMMGVPTFYTRLLSRPDFGPEQCRTLRLFISGSAPLLAETHRAFAERTGQMILERYGMTETGMIASNPLEGERRAGTVGLPLPDVEVRICDAEGRALATGESGVVEVRGPNIFKGYWRQPEKTKAEIRGNGFFITGDVGFLDQTGYLTLVGRAKDLIISGGFNVYPKEVEEVLDALPGVVESAVVGLPHPDFGEAVTAVIVHKGEVPAEAEVIRIARQQLAAFKVPKRVLYLPELPRNAMGKVQKAVLRQTYQDLYRS